MDRILCPSKTHTKALANTTASGRWASEEVTKVECGQQHRADCLLGERQQCSFHMLGYSKKEASPNQKTALLSNQTG